jgi:hypothetical protein
MIAIKSLSNCRVPSATSSAEVSGPGAFRR